MSSSTVSASSVIIPVLLVFAFLAVLLIITGIYIYIQVDRKTRRHEDKKTRRQEQGRQEDKKTRRKENKNTRKTSLYKKRQKTER